MAFKKNVNKDGDSDYDDEDDSVVQDDGMSVSDMGDDQNQSAAKVDLRGDGT